jgi:hypothetical protein
MSANETIMENKLRRSKTISLLLVVLFTLSTMSLPACSDNDNNTLPQRVAHATVYFDEEGTAAVAWVQDRDQNFVSDAILTINNRPFEVIFLGDEESDEDSVPIYYLELYDLKGGDSLTFVAKRPDGTVIYAPPSSQIPMPLELVEPEPDQTLVPGEEVVVRWAGGEGSSHIAAFYADDLGEEQYWNVQKYGDVESIKVPPGIIREGGGIIGAAALTGDHSSVQVSTSADPVELSFLVIRVAAVIIPNETYLERSSAGRPPHRKIGSAGISCPHDPDSVATSTALCTLEFVTGIGAIVWGARYARDAHEYPPCRLVPSGSGAEVIMSPLLYCTYYSTFFSHVSWSPGCLCPTSVR